MPMDEAVRWMLQLNGAASAIISELGVSAATDVTGYGLAGHLMEMCRGAGLVATIEIEDVPLLDHARRLAAEGVAPEGSRRNLETLGMRLEGGDEVDRLLACDAQTSGGLLFAANDSLEDALHREFGKGGLLLAKIGRFETGEPRIEIRTSTP